MAALTIAAENALTDNIFPRANWTEGIERRVDIPAFARSSYYQPGQTAQFSVDYTLGYTVEIYRLGWYGGGNGNARRVATFAGTPTNQPEAVVIPDSNGAVDCAHWPVTDEWEIPADATPGWYWALFKGTDNPAHFFTLAFCITDTLDKKPIVVLSSDSTYGAAYNYYGGKAAPLAGKSVYGSNGPMTGGITNRSLAVSYDRPVVTREGIPQTYFMNAEYPLMRYLERMGLEVGHVTNEQVDADPTVLDGRQMVIVAGHNEYTSQPVWDKFEQLKASTSTHLLNLSGNDFFWRTRYGTATARADQTKGRVMWCDKATMPGPGGHVAGTPIVAGDWGGTWQDSRWTARVAETGRDHWSKDLWGDWFVSNGIRHDNLRVLYEHKDSPMWRDCASIQSLTAGQSYDFGPGTLGMEWDIPMGDAEKVYLSETTVDLGGNSSDINGENYNLNGTWTHHLLMMAAPGGGVVFNAANVQHSWVLENVHDRGGAVATAAGMQSMLNLLVDLGAVPDAASVTAAGLVNPTPVGDLRAAYGLSAAPAPATPLQAWVGGEWIAVEVLGVGSGGALALVEVLIP